MSSSSFNQYMHPRNIFKEKPPDFKRLAGIYPHFRSFCTIKPDGKVKVDFKDSMAVLALTKAILQDSFNLEVDIPSDSLVPRIPQRLNYILWVQDILSQSGCISAGREALGIDIGTGASCIYPLLGAVVCGWRFLATDKDSKAVESAKNNVQQNGLEEKITVTQVGPDTALYGAISSDSDENTSQKVQYDFCMCNPPFFDNSELVGFDDNESESGSLVRKNDRPCRPQPSSSSVARKNEVCAEGGEVAFVSKMIDDSCKLQTKVKVYTSMIGKKANLSQLKRHLSRVGASMCETTFYQGKTLRWALAWTFDPSINLNTVVKSNNGPEKRRAPSSLDLRKFPCIRDATEEILAILKQLQIVCDLNDSGDLICTAWHNTWCGQRRKRRAGRNWSGTIESQEANEQPPTKRLSIPDDDKGVSLPVKNTDSTTTSLDIVGIHGNNNCNNSPEKSEQFGRKNVQDNTSFLVKFTIAIKQGEEGVIAEFEWLDGQGQNRDLLNQILQFMKNTLKTSSAESRPNLT